jgi:hypothetical protein
MRLPATCTFAGFVLAASLACTAASAQSYKIDFGAARSAPSPTYAAAGLPGEWNILGVPTPGTFYPLVNLAGETSGVTLNNIGGTQLLSIDDAATAGDDQALIDDMLIGFNDPIDVCIWINNLPAGQWEVLIYAITPGDPALLSRTRVDNADQGPTFVGGAWPGQHELGVTFSRHTVNVTNGVIGLHSGLFGGQIQSGINAIQVRRLIAGDATGDGAVDVDDLVAVILAWGACGSCESPSMCPADFDHTCSVDVDDLIAVILGWG